MKDRFRLGEQLTAIAAVVLLVLLPVGTWFAIGGPEPDRGLPGGVYVSGAAGATHLGWFAFGVVCLAELAALLFLLRVITAKTTERVMLQAPFTFVIGLFATIVLAVRMLVFTPGFDETFSVAGPEHFSTVHFGATITQGGWLGLLAVAAIPLGAWISMADERLGTEDSYLRTKALVADVPVRRVPGADGVPATPDPSDVVVADDAAPNDSSTAPGGLA